MKIISWNINGIRAILKKNFLDFVRKEKPDIICLQEIKAQKDQVEKILEDYKYQFWNSAEKKGYSGTIIFSKEKPISVETKIGNILEKEGRVIILEFEGFYLINCYTPNSKRSLERLPLRKKWDKDFLNLLKKLKKEKGVVLCGDLNVAHEKIDLANPETNYNKVAGYTQTEIDGFKKILKFGFIDTFRKFNKNPGNYTYWGQWNNLRERNIGWRIDYFLVSENFISAVKNSIILNKVKGSDHCPISIELK